MSTRTVLIVEDDPNDENLTLRGVKRSGVDANVIVVRSSQEALDYFACQGTFADREQSNPSLVFLDNTLPGSVGHEMVLKIRSQETLRHMPIVVLSGSSDQVVVEKCLQAGANSFLEKPLEMTDYVQSVSLATQYWLLVNVGFDDLSAVASFS